MHSRLLLPALAALASSARGIRIVQGNDDGWAELYIREFHDTLIDAGHDVVLSSPAENKSGASECGPSSPSRTRS